MWNKIKTLFKKEVEREGWVSGFKFKDAIKALGMEVYKDVTVIYLEKPSKTSDPLSLRTICIYHFFYKKEFYFEEAETYEELQELAHTKIDSLK